MISTRTGYLYSPQNIGNLVVNHPELRLKDCAANMHMAQLMMMGPEDADLQELMNLVIGKQARRALSLDDALSGNYSPKGAICYPSDFIELGKMPTGDPIGVLISQLTGNVLLVGPTKSAKTSLLLVLLSYPQLLKSIRICAFVKKRELRRLMAIPELRDQIVVFKLEELALCYLQPPPGVPQAAWNNEVTRIPAQCYCRYSAQRLMSEKVNELTVHHPPGAYPSLRHVVKVIEEFKPRFGMREAGYKESILWCLKDLLNCTGGIWDYSYSNFLEQLYSEPGLCIIEAEALPQEHLTFVATYFMRWLYFKRVFAGEIVA